MEEFRINLEKALSKYVNLLPSKEARNQISEAEIFTRTSRAQNENWRKDLWAGKGRAAITSRWEIFVLKEDKSSLRVKDIKHISSFCLKVKDYDGTGWTGSRDRICQKWTWEENVSGKKKNAKWKKCSDWDVMKAPRQKQMQQQEEKKPYLLDLEQHQTPDDKKDKRIQRCISSLLTESFSVDLIPLPYSFRSVVKDESPPSSPAGIQHSSKVFETDP